MTEGLEKETVEALKNTSQHLKTISDTLMRILEELKKYRKDRNHQSGFYDPTDAPQ